MAPGAEALWSFAVRPTIRANALTESFGNPRAIDGAKRAAALGTGPTTGRRFPERADIA